MKSDTARQRKWKLYHEVEKWISPHPSWQGHPDVFSINDFISQFKITKSEANLLIVKLIENKKLIKTGDKGVYKAIRVCTMCGKTFDDWDLQENNHIKHYFGYGSKHDLQIFEADLCSNCYDKIIDTILPLFPSSPIRESNTYSDSPEYQPYTQDKFEHDNNPY